MIKKKIESHIMKIIIFGATGFVGQRLTALLLKKGHEVLCFARNPEKIKFLHSLGNLRLFQGDLLKEETLQHLPQDVDVAYFLVHTLFMENFQEKEKRTAENFLSYIHKTKTQQIIFLSGIINDTVLSKHLQSRKQVEDILKKSDIPYTILRAGIILGNDSASFMILRDLVEKLPIMIAPKWVDNRLKPISIFNTTDYLEEVLGDKRAYNQTFDISSDEEISYKDLLLLYANMRKLQRYIITIPLLTPRLSSYWLIFITSQDFLLARSLVESLKSNFIPQNEEIKKLYPVKIHNLRDSFSFLMSPIDEEAHLFFNQEGTIPKTALLWGEKQKQALPQDPSWQKIFENNEKTIYFQERTVGEFWIETTDSHQRFLFRPRGILGRFYQCLSFFTAKAIWKRALE
jgi:uncharacterized protein YbjT (DUF2867 family)